MNPTLASILSGEDPGNSRYNPRGYTKSGENAGVKKMRLICILFWIRCKFFESKKSNHYRNHYVWNFPMSWLNTWTCKTGWVKSCVTACLVEELNESLLKNFRNALFAPSPIQYAPILWRRNENQFKKTSFAHTSTSSKMIFKYSPVWT